MADNTNKVTIDAAWFAELYAAKNGNNVAASKWQNEAAIWKKRYEGECYENDELKAKLEDARHMQAVANENSTAFQKRLEAAERCIDTIAININCQTSWENKHKIIEDAIRAYREKKEEK